MATPITTIIRTPIQIIQAIPFPPTHTHQPPHPISHHFPHHHHGIHISNLTQVTMFRNNINHNRFLTQLSMVFHFLTLQHHLPHHPHHHLRQNQVHHIRSETRPKLSKKLSHLLIKKKLGKVWLVSIIFDQTFKNSLITFDKDVLIDTIIYQSLGIHICIVLLLLNINESMQIFVPTLHIYFSHFALYIFIFKGFHLTLNKKLM